MLESNFLTSSFSSVLGSLGMNSVYKLLWAGACLLRRDFGGWGAGGGEGSHVRGSENCVSGQISWTSLISLGHLRASNNVTTTTKYYLININILLVPFILLIYYQSPLSIISLHCLTSSITVATALSSSSHCIRFVRLLVQAEYPLSGNSKSGMFQNPELFERRYNPIRRRL